MTQSQLYGRERYARRHKMMLDYLGSKCTACGKNEHLQIDHINPTNKTMDLTTNYARPWLVLIAEMKKCQILCRACHRIKTSLESRKTVTHGKYYAAYPLKCTCTLCIQYKVELNRKNRKFPQTKGRMQELIHGTRAGYHKEIRRGLSTCDSCKDAQADYMREYNKNRRVV